MPLIPILLVLGSAVSLPDVTSATQEEARLDATVTVEPNETPPGLPIAIYVTMTNAGTKRVSMPAFLSVETRSLAIRIETPEGKEIQVAPWVAPDEQRETVWEKRSPGVSITSKVWLGWGPGGIGAYFPVPGVYRVEVRVETSGQELPVQEIVVRGPWGREVEAEAIFRRHEEEIADLFRGVPVEDDHEVLEDLRILRRDYDETIYGKYSRYLLSKQAARRSTERPPKRTAVAGILGTLDAIDHLLRLDWNGPPENIRFEVRLALAELTLGRGEARAWLAELEDVDLPEPLESRRQALLWNRRLK